MTPNWFDVVLALILIWSFLGGLRTGFVRVVIGLIATVAGIFAGFWCYRMLAVKLQPWVSSETTANIGAFLLIFAGALIAGSLLAAIISRLFNAIGLSWLDHLLGGAVGVLRGAIAVAALVAAIVAFSPSPPPTFLRQSQVLPYAAVVSTWLADLAPRELKDAWTQQADTLRQWWQLHKRKEPTHEV